MARFVHIDYPAQHAGVARLEHSVDTLRGFNGGRAVHAVFGALALIGSPLVSLLARVRTGLAAWREERRQREEDRKLWNLALTDARVMADLSRAMSQDARGIDGRYF